jgi:hypothetical protein
MTKDEALDLALEALIDLTNEMIDQDFVNQGMDAITAIKQARSAPVQEPLFWYKPHPNGMFNGPIHNAQLGDILRGSEEWVPLYTTPPAAPVQKPVWIRPDDLQKAQKAPFLCRVEPNKRDDFVPLYAIKDKNG